VRIFKNTRFARYAGKEDISDNELREAVNQLEAGQADANLGGNVYKLRVARSGEGKSGGYRVIVLFRSGDKTFYEKEYQSKILQAIHEDAKEFHKEELISDERMRYYDRGCLVQEPNKTRKPAATAGSKPAVRISAKGIGS